MKFGKLVLGVCVGMFVYRAAQRVIANFVDEFSSGQGLGKKFIFSSNNAKESDEPKARKIGFGEND